MLDINDIHKNQILNLIEFSVLIKTVAESVDKLDSPDYLLEKFLKYFGYSIVPTVIEVRDGRLRYYHQYASKWRIDLNTDKLIRNVFYFIHDLCTNGYDFENSISYFNEYFTGVTTTNRYSYINAKLRIEVFDKVLLIPKIARILTISELHPA